MTYDLDFQSQANYDHHTHKLKLKGQSVRRTEWKQTDGQSDSYLPC